MARVIHAGGHEYEKPCDLINSVHTGGTIKFPATAVRCCEQHEKWNSSSSMSFIQVLVKYKLEQLCTVYCASFLGMETLNYK